MSNMVSHLPSFAGREKLHFHLGGSEGLFSVLMHGTVFIVLCLLRDIVGVPEYIPVRKLTP